MRGRNWLVPLLLLLGGCAPREKESQEVLRQALQVPHYRGELSPQLLQTWKHRDLIFEQLRFHGRDNQWVAALACYSELARFRPLPALLCIPGSSNRKEELLQPLDLLPRWADQGFFVLSIDRSQDEEILLRQKGLPGLWGHQVYNLMRAVDYLQNRPEVAGGRIGMLGLSMGGMEALWLAALDQRIGVVVSASGHLVWAEIFATDSWKLIFGDLPLGRELLASGVSGARAREAFNTAYPQLAELDAVLVAPGLAPRPLLLVTGDLDPYITPGATRRVYEAAESAYADSGRASCLEMWVEPQVGHGFSAAMQERALDWFRRWL
ncbi:MAG: prolyl oligopeptidase family serine peptidase [Candidatus Latescibacteria bacterium]|nr:prolyl oligopeptidase family serine peptidase [Candidatus Latescibacterota bacterium]